MAAALRQARLDKLFEQVTAGRADVSSHTALFLEALCSQRDPLSAFDKVTSKPAALDFFQTAVTAELSITFFNSRFKSLIKFLQTPQFAIVAGGALLTKLVDKMSTPRSLLNEGRNAMVSGQLDKEAQLGFCWLVSQLVNRPARSSDDEDLAVTTIRYLETSSDAELQTRATMLDRIIHPPQAGTTTAATASITNSQPGGRHDNDFDDFKQIAILPTAEEMQCAKAPHLLTALALNDAPGDDRARLAVDNQFRLLREDMLYELREELLKLTKASGKKGGGRSRGFEVEGLRLRGISNSTGGKFKTRWQLELECLKDLSFFAKVKPSKRRDALDADKRFIKHQSLASLVIGGRVVAFGEINRSEDHLARKLPVILLQLEGEKNITDALLSLKLGEVVKLVQVDVAVFAYAPVLKALQRMPVPVLSPELFLWDNTPLLPPPQMPTSFVDDLQRQPNMDIGPPLRLRKRILLDEAQRGALLAALTQRVSLIQGPPGTGKSFVGALAAKALYVSSEQKILVCCYNNHALDQFLEDIMDNGIPASEIVRLGGKSTTKTAPLLMSKQQPVSRLTRHDWADIDNARFDVDTYWDDLEEDFQSYISQSISDADLLAHMESDDPPFFTAFFVPPAGADGMSIIGRNGKPINDLYLLQQWSRGSDAGVLKNHPSMKPRAVAAIWRMRKDERAAKRLAWYTAIQHKHVARLCDRGARYDKAFADLQTRFDARDVNILRSKRIIGCTTTAAAKYMDALRTVGPDVLIVEEAGTILEPHILTALSGNTEQMILIGDHQQLRPKVNNYQLTVEKGSGFELNVSLFERLVKSGYPHSTLKKQHRMRPEISDLVRHLTYHDLVDAAGTQNRPDLRGIRDNVVFITHSHPEDDIQGVSEGRDGGAKSSKQNSFEISMVLKIIKYLGQQGYSTEDVAVLTPYLGQLSKLRAALAKDNDPYLSDMDMADLVRAGLVTAGAAKSNKKPLRLSTIDTAQGEEWKVVVISLTRSNAANDIGFMFSPERLNVLLSRARDGMIIIGNAETFRNSRKGGDLWSKFLANMLDKGKVFDGLPTRCERHPDHTSLLSNPEDFDEKCPDGGCLEPCGVTLNCGKHQCPSKCHAIVNHSKMRCTIRLDYVCKFSHKKVYACADGPPQTCSKCEGEIQEENKRAKLRQEEQERIEEEQRARKRELERIDREIEAERQAQRIEQEQRARKRELERIDKQIEAERQARRDTRIRAEQQEFLRVKALAELRQERDRTTRPMQVASSPPQIVPPRVTAAFAPPVKLTRSPAVPPPATTAPALSSATRAFLGSSSGSRSTAPISPLTVPAPPTARSVPSKPTAPSSAAPSSLNLTSWWTAAINLFST